MTQWDNYIADLPDFILEYLEKLKSIKERPDFHPESINGSALDHVKIVFNRAEKTKNLDLILAAIFHDLGKVDTVRVNQKTGYNMTPGHEFVSTKILENPEVIHYIDELGGHYDKIKFIVSNHMRMHQLSNMKPEKQQALRSSPYFKDLEIFSRMDDMLNPEFD